MKNSPISYEDAVAWMRAQPEHSDLVKLCYLDEDNLKAAKRFASSEEFADLKRVLKLGPSNKKLKMLDIGCGNGIASYSFAALGLEVFAVDPDASRDVGIRATARFATTSNRGSVSPVQAFAESLPFMPGTFDIVYLRQALHHFSDLRTGLRECSRVLRANGVLLATREHVVSDEKQLETFLNDHILHKFHGGEHAYRLEEYLDRFKDAGLRIVRCFGPFDTVINHFPTSNSDLNAQLHQRLQERLGKTATALITRLQVAETLYRRRLSRKCDFAGRLFSFLAVKREMR